MKKNISRAIVIGICCFAGGVAVFFAWNNIRRSREQITLPPIASEPGITLGENDEAAKEDEKEQGAQKQIDLLRAEARKIAEEPFLVKDANLNASQTEGARIKIGTAKDRIFEKYDDASAWLELGAQRSFIGDNNGAIRAWKFLAKIRPDLFVSFYNIGDTYAFKLHNFIEGEKYFEQSILSNPFLVDGYIALATLYQNKAEGFDRTGKIEEILKKGIARNANSALLKIRLAEYYRDTGQKENAIYYYEEALKLDSSNRAAIEAEIESLNARS